MTEIGFAQNPLTSHPHQPSTEAGGVRQKALQNARCSSATGLSGTFAVLPGGQPSSVSLRSTFGVKRPSQSHEPAKDCPTEKQVQRKDFVCALYSSISRDHAGQKVESEADERQQSSGKSHAPKRSNRRRGFQCDLGGASSTTMCSRANVHAGGWQVVYQLHLREMRAAVITGACGMTLERGLPVARRDPFGQTLLPNIPASNIDPLLGRSLRRADSLHNILPKRTSKYGKVKLSEVVRGVVPFQHIVSGHTWILTEVHSQSIVRIHSDLINRSKLEVGSFVVLHQRYVAASEYLFFGTPYGDCMGYARPIVLDTQIETLEANCLC